MRNIETKESTALIAVETVLNGPAALTRTGRPDAPFLAQLIATAANDPQTRNLRMGTPADALSGYGMIEDASARRSNPNGSLFSRVA